MDPTTQETLKLFKEALATPDAELSKAWTAPSGAVSGLQTYSLEAPSKKLFPILSPLRNEIPRAGGFGGNALNWRSITAIDTTLTTMGIEEGKRGGEITTTTADHVDTFVTLGQEDSVTFEADEVAQGFEDLRATAHENLLSSVMINEEYAILGGNASLDLVKPTKPAGVAVAAGTACTLRAAVKCYVVGLTLDGYRRSSMAGGIAKTVTRTNADGSTTAVKLGSSGLSTVSDAVAVAAGDKVTWTTTALKGAVAYAWYTGAAGAEKLAAITTAPVFVQVADESAAAEAAALIIADNSKNVLTLNGLLTQIFASGVWKDLGGAKLTSDGGAGITEIEDVLQNMFDLYRTQPDEIWVSSRQTRDIRSKVVAQGATPAVRINYEGGQSGQASLIAGTIVSEYLSAYSPMPKPIPIRVHPYLPSGTIMGLSKTLPYRLAGVPSVARVATRREYYSQDWPLKTRKYEFGVYVTELLQVYAPFSCFLLTGVGEG